MNYDLEKIARELVDLRGTVIRYDGIGWHELTSPNESNYANDLQRYMNADSILDYSYNRYNDTITSCKERKILNKIVDENGNVVLILEKL